MYQGIDRFTLLVGKPYWRERSSDLGLLVTRGLWCKIRFEFRVPSSLICVLCRSLSLSLSLSVSLLYIWGPLSFSLHVCLSGWLCDCLCLWLFSSISLPLFFTLSLYVGVPLCVSVRVRLSVGVCLSPPHCLSPPPSPPPRPPPTNTHTHTHTHTHTLKIDYKYLTHAQPEKRKGVQTDSNKRKEGKIGE